MAELARVPALSPGVMSAGIGSVPSEQTFLDVSQGNRIDDALYDRALPGLFPFAREVPGWAVVLARADGAPADLVPGLVAERLASGGVPAYAQQPMTAAALIASNERGVVRPLRPGACADSCLAVVRASLAELTRLSRRLGGDDLLIAIASPPPARDRALPIGISGRGFDGDLTSDSTRTSGYVLSTDIGPTIMRRFGLPIPDQMDGEPMRGEGSVDPAAVDDLADRMAVIPGRRAPVLIASLASWIAIALVVAAFAPGARRAAAAWLALAFAYLPLMLLAGAAIEPGGFAEGLLVGIGCAALAALTLRLGRGWSALATACAVSALAYAVDVIVGSGLTRLSLLGPNPILGARFYGIGNELEALFAVMVPVGVGAGLSAYTGWGRETRSGRTINEGRAAGAFLLAGLLAGLVFGLGRFGADVGAAMVLPVGAAVATAALPSSGPIRATSRRSLILGLALTPFIALFLLALIDLASGAHSHLTRSVLDAGGASDLADVVERRIRLSAHDFAQAAGNPLFWVVVVGIGVGISQWRRIDTWLRPAPMARAGLIGACAAVAVGVVVNDSGATFLVLGGLALGAFVAFSWSQAGEIGGSPRNPRVERV